MGIFRENTLLSKNRNHRNDGRWTLGILPILILVLSLCCPSATTGIGKTKH